MEIHSRLFTVSGDHIVAHVLILRFVLLFLNVLSNTFFSFLLLLFSVSAKRVTSVDISPNGDWLVLGSAKLGQLLVWEWQSESCA
jgi:WD40 repeat protein